MKSIWTEGEVRTHRPLKSHMKSLWASWIASAVLLCLWLAGMSMGRTFDGWLHALIGGAVVLWLLNIAYTFRYAEYLEPFFYRWFRGSKLRHVKPPPHDDRPVKLP
jgi:hypothetical protein